MAAIDGRRIGLTAATASLCLFLSTGGTYAAPTARFSSATDPAPRSQAWPDAASISSSRDIDSEAPALVVTDGDIAHVVWEEGDELYHAHQESSSWSAPSRVATGEQPSLAVGPDDVTIADGEASVTVHNIGGSASPPSGIEVRASSGEVLGAGRAPALEPPHDLQPRTAGVRIQIKRGATPALVVLDPANQVAEITEANNELRIQGR